MKYFHACFGPNILKISPTPFVRARRGVEALFRFKILFDANAVGVFDYLQKVRIGFVSVHRKFSYGV